MSQKAIPVSLLNEYIKDTITLEPILQQVWVSGEITSFKIYGAGKQAYFTLSDPYAQLNCVMFKDALEGCKTLPKVGDQVLAFGSVNYYHKKGSLTFQTAFLASKGLGSLQEQFEKLKEKLTGEGLFDPERKQPLPKYPEKIALITAYDSAAMWDFISICEKKAPSIHLIVVPAIMQGANCAPSVRKALQLTQTIPDLDLVVLMRGGGSAEDLASFNHEALTRDVANHPLPLVSAIGHEIDYTLPDFAADYRAPTPSAAAHTITEPYSAITEYLIPKLLDYQHLLQNDLTHYHDQLSYTLKNITQHISFHHQNTQSQVKNILHRLHQTNPILKLEQGFSITRLAENNTIIKSTKDCPPNTQLSIQLTDGTITANTL